MDILWCGPVADSSGYGHASRHYLHWLHKEYKDAINVRVVQRNFFNGELIPISKDYPEITEMSVAQHDSYSCYIQNLTPNTFALDDIAKFHIGMTTFETDGLPRNWVSNMQMMDAIITYTEFNRTTFQSSGVTRPIYVVPHGVDTDVFKPNGPCFQKIRETLAGSYIFGSVFDWTERKNPELLLEAYFKAFEGKSDVALILKCFYQFPISRSRKIMMEKIDAVKSKMGTSKLPPVYIISDVLSDMQMPMFYNSIDALVSCSGGEGWGLCFSEGMASGLPVIATNWSGNTEFMNSDNSLLIDCTIRNIPDKFVAIHPDYSGQKWAFPEYNDLVDKMRFLYHNRQKGAELGAVARKDIEEKWTWKHAVDKLSSILTSMFGE
jgi:glycosyltransferase involved in cell wall biosynthesis